MAENVDLSMFVPNVHFEQIPIKDLVSNQNYQRDLSMAHVAKTAEHFDPYQINPVKVSRRNGVNYVFNGQHTIEIVAKVSGSRETPVWCMIYDDLEYIFIIAMSWNVIDLLIMDWLVICRITPKWVVIQGTEGCGGYHDYWYWKYQRSMKSMCLSWMCWMR